MQTSIKGVPDIHSLRAALEMGYEVIPCGDIPYSSQLAYPVYNMEFHDASDFAGNSKWPTYIHRQRERIGRYFFRSPGDMQTHRPRELIQLSFKL